MRAIAHTKKLFEDSFGVGNVPPQIAFLAFDFDKSVVNDKTLATDVSESFVDLSQAFNPLLVYQSKNRLASSVFPQNASYLPDHVDCGAAQVRSNGFLFAAMVKKCIDSALQTVMARVLSLSNTQGGYSLTDDEYVSVYIVSSLVGGTGSAMMLDVAHTVRKSYGKARIHGYGISHSIFGMMDPMGIVTPRIISNAYASILELDYVQSATLESPVVIEIAGKEVTITSPLFDEFYVVDNKTQAGAVVCDIKDLCVATGCSMYYGACDLGSSNAIDWTKRGLMWHDKQSWVHCFGVCQIVYKGQDLEHRYRKLASLRLLSMMQGSCRVSVADAHTWLELANLREDGDAYDKLIESICPSDNIARVKELTLDSHDSAEELNVYIEKYITSKTVLWNKQHVSGISEKATAALRAEAGRLASQEGGLRNAISFLAIILDLFRQYKGEMLAEADTYRKKAELSHAKLINLRRDYDLCRKKWFTKFTGARKSLVATISSAAHQHVKDILQAQRREDADTVFTDLINEVSSLSSTLAALSAIVSSLEEDAKNSLRKEEQIKRSASLFEIDLSAQEQKLLKVEDVDVSYCDFISKISSVIGSDRGMIIKALEEYTVTLPQVARYRDRSVCDIIDGMDDKEYLELKKQMFRKSSPLLPLSDRGLLNGALASNSPITNMMKDFYIHYHCPNPEYKNRLECDTSLGTGNNTKVKFIPTDDADSRQRINIHRVDSAIMPYCIESLDEFVKESYLSAINNTKSYNPHVSTQFYNALSTANFKLEPSLD